MKIGFIIKKDGRYAEIPMTEQEFEQFKKFILALHPIKDDLWMNGYKIDFTKFMRLFNSKNHRFKSKAKIKLKHYYKEIGLTVREIRHLYDLMWDLYEVLSMHDALPPVDKMMHLVHDVIDEGKVYKLEGDKIIPAGIKYVVQKPNWKKR